MSEKIPFTKVMRKETRGIHNISDALINAKLGIAMSDNEVWAGGLLVFYEVFKHLELAMDRLKGTIIEKLDIPGMRRTAAFEKDLRFYLGDSWQSSYTPHPSVQRYLLHLTALESDQPVLLLPYIYHLYMGLFAGGQVLKKKRAMVLKLSFAGPGKGDEGLAVVNLERNIYEVKKEMAEAMNRIAEGWDEELKKVIVEESKRVFLMNNQIVQSVKGANRVIASKVVKGAVVVAVVALIYYYCKRW